MFDVRPNVPFRVSLEGGNHWRAGHVRAYVLYVCECVSVCTCISKCVQCHVRGYSRTWLIVCLQTFLRNKYVSSSPRAQRTHKHTHM